MLAFVVGPSGVGKSSLIRSLAFEVFDLDDVDNRSGMVEWAAGWEGRRWDRDAVRLARLSAAEESRNVVVDVGAGSLQTPLGRAYFRSRCDRMVAVVAPWHEVYYRRLHRPYTPEEFRATEYSEDRLALYAAAKFTVDASSSEDSAASELDRHLKAILNPVGK